VTDESRVTADLTAGSAPRRAALGLPRRMATNILTNYATVFLVAVAGLVTTPIMLKYLGVAEYGIWVLAGSVVGYLEILELGFGTATTKLIAEDADKRTERVLRTLNTNVFVLTVMGFLALIGGLVMSYYAPAWFNVPPDLESATQKAFVILTVAIAVSIPFDTFGGALNAYQRLDLLSLTNMWRALGAAIGGAVVAVLGGGVVAVTLVTAIFGMSAHLLRWRMLRRIIPGLRLSLRLVERAQIGLTAKLSWWFMLRDAAVVVTQRLDLVVVGVMLGLHAVAAYSIGLKLAQMGMKAMQPFSALFFPRASGLAAEGDVRGLGALLVDGTRVSLAVANPIMLLLSILAWPLVVAWVGDGLGDAVPVLVLLALARGAASVAETAWWLLGGAGWIRWTASLSMLEAAVNLGSSILLAPVYGPAGVAAGTLIGVVLTRLPVSFVLSPRATGISPAKFAAGALRPHVAPVVVTALALFLARSLIPPDPLPVLVTAGASCALYWAVYLLTGAAPAERDRVRHLLTTSSHGVGRHRQGRGA